MDEPRALAVHPANGLMFWTDWGKLPRIESAFLDGSSRKIIVGTSIGWPNGLAIDFEQNRLYWADAQLDRIEAVDFDGQNRLVVVKQVLHPYGVAVHGPYVYWTDWQNKAIERADKHNGLDKQLITDNIEFLMEIRMVTAARAQGG